MHCRIQTLALLLLPVAVVAQEYPNEKDISTLDGIIEAYYEVVSGPAGESADRARDHSLHYAGALVGITSVDQAGTPTIRLMTLDEYHDASGGPRAAAFYEREVHRIAETFGNVTHVWSTYEYRDTPDGTPTGRGINSIQLYNDGSRWWITSWIFDSERPGNRIPAQYLNNQ